LGILAWKSSIFGESFIKRYILKEIKQQNKNAEQMFWRQSWQSLAYDWENNFNCKLPKVNTDYKRQAHIINIDIKYRTLYKVGHPCTGQLDNGNFWIGNNYTFCHCDCNQL